MDALITKYDVLEKELTRAIECDEKFERVQMLDREMMEIVEAIKLHTAVNADEVKKQIRFFQQRAIGGVEGNMVQGDQMEVDRLIGRYIQVEDLPKAKNLKAHAYLDELRIQPDPELIRLQHRLNPNKHRFAIFGTDFQYRYISPASNSFYRTDTSEFVGQHIVNIIGEERFEQRAKAHLQTTFSGKSVSYNYLLDVAALGERIMECNLLPMQDGEGRVVATFFRIEDMTERYETTLGQLKSEPKLSAGPSFS